MPRAKLRVGRVTQVKGCGLSGARHCDRTAPGAGLGTRIVPSAVVPAPHLDSDRFDPRPPIRTVPNGRTWRSEGEKAGPVFFF